MAFTAATAAAIATLFTPIPATAAPAAPEVPIPAIPDPGSRPISVGALVMPGQTSTTVTTPTTTPSIATTPVVAEDQRRRSEIASLGDQLIALGQNRDQTKQQQAPADARVAAAQAVFDAAQRDAATAAVNSLHDEAALPPGTLGSGLAELDQLAQMQRGDATTEQSASRQLAIAQAALTAAQGDQASIVQQVLDLSTQYDQLNAQIASKQAALQKYEQQHATELNAAETAENAQNAALGALYLQGAGQGRGADRRAIAALVFALSQRGKPYQWSTEGPNTYDCSGLMYAAYHQAAAGDFPLVRVARDQYWQTHNKVVDRYSLLPGDLLFFSSTNSWTGIHHVAMYAGNGLMVEAPRTNLDVRLVPVRWTELFQATRVYGSVDGPVQGPNLNAPPSTTPTTPPIKSPTKLPTSKPPTKLPTSKPPTTLPTSKPPTTLPTTPATTPPTTPPTTPSTPSESQNASATPTASASKSASASASASKSASAQASTATSASASG